MYLFMSLREFKMSKYYVVYQGKVTETEYASNYGKTTTVRIKTNSGIVQYSGMNTDYICDKNGKSINSGKYHNFMDDFFPWVNGVFDEDRLKLNPNYEFKRVSHE